MLLERGVPVVKRTESNGSMVYWYHQCFAEAARKLSIPCETGKSPLQSTSSASLTNGQQNSILFYAFDKTTKLTDMAGGELKPVSLCPHAKKEATSKSFIYKPLMTL